MFIQFLTLENGHFDFTGVSDTLCAAVAVLATEFPVQARKHVDCGKLTRGQVRLLCVSILQIVSQDRCSPLRTQTTLKKQNEHAYVPSSVGFLPVHAKAGAREVVGPCLSLVLQQGAMIFSRLRSARSGDRLCFGTRILTLAFVF